MDRGAGFGLSGAYALAGLRKMALYGFGAVGAVFRCIGIGQARPAGVVAGFNGGEPGGFDGEAGSSMEVVDKSAHTKGVTDFECHGCGGACGGRRVL